MREVRLFRPFHRRTGPAAIQASTMVVPSPAVRATSGADRRAKAECAMGQPLIADNRPGAGGTGTAIAAEAPANAILGDRRKTNPRNHNRAASRADACTLGKIGGFSAVPLRPPAQLFLQDLSDNTCVIC